jgi:pimeloyl-ACP methyl ester carboxylesterase
MPDPVLGGGRPGSGAERVGPGPQLQRHSAGSATACGGVRRSGGACQARPVWARDPSCPQRPGGLAYDLRGRGSPLVLIQGVGVGRWGWEPVADRIARRFQVITIDNRGIGASDASPGHYSTRMRSSMTRPTQATSGWPRCRGYEHSGRGSVVLGLDHWRSRRQATSVSGRRTCK